MLASILSGHVDLADWLWLIAAVLFAVAGVLAAIQKPDPTHGALVPFGLSLVALGWLVL